MRLFSRRTPPFVDAAKNRFPDSISELEFPQLNGLRQGVLIRGENRSNPTLVVLHGGPGGAYIGGARSWLGFLERNWVVVNWDERGAGLSYSRSVPPTSLTPRQLSEDALSLVGWLESRFGLGRFYLLAHSFGTLLAPFILERAPDRFEGYIAIGVAPTDVKGESLAYDWTVSRAQELGNRKALGQLKDLGPPPYRPTDNGLSLRAHWTDELGGAWEGSTGTREAYRALRAGSEYTWGDLILRLLPGIRFWMRHVDKEFSREPLPQRFARSPVPTTFIQGADDWMAPASWAKAYFDLLTAPRKRFHLLDRTGHYPFAQNPEGFVDVMSRLA